ncbi:MAG: formyltransferase family protein [Planctomycetaceae bacterium]
MKVALCGYNWIGCHCLRRLLDAGHDVAVFTHESPYHINSLLEYALKSGVDVTTEPIATGRLQTKPDILCSVFYREIIPRDVLQTVEGKAFNVHPSLLPEYRGCSSLTWAMINGESEVGYTYHYLTQDVDRGDIILQRPILVEDFDTQQSLYERVMFEAAKDFMPAFSLVTENISGIPQPRGVGQHYRRGCPHGGQIDPTWNDEKVERFVRAMIAPPLPVATYCGTPIRTFREYRQIVDQ